MRLTPPVQNQYSNKYGADSSLHGTRRRRVARHMVGVGGCFCFFRVVSAWGIWLLANVVSIPLAADEPVLGISVAGSGEVMAQPNLLEIQLSTSGSAELSGDALIKYREATKRTMDAFTQLGVPGLRIAQRGLGIQSQDVGEAQARGIGDGGQPGKVDVNISGDLRLSLPGIDKMSEDEVTDIISKLLDAARDSGASLAGNAGNQMFARMYGQQLSSSVVTFVVANLDEYRERAYQEAFQQARTRAKRLADLSGAKLGPVISIQESDEEAPQPESSRQQKIMAAIYGWGDLGADGKDRRVSSDKLGEVPVRVSLRVRFALLP